jgi:hypothetical protein
MKYLSADLLPKVFHGLIGVTYLINVLGIIPMLSGGGRKMVAIACVYYWIRYIFFK